MFTKWIAGNPLERFFTLTGLALNAIFLINLIALFIPPRFLNPSWELQTISTLVGLAPVLLLGVAFVGCGKYMQEKPEKFRSLQVYCYLLAGLFALSIPIYAFDSIRLYTEATSRIDQQRNRVTEEIERQESRLESLTKSGGLPPTFDTNQAKDRIKQARSQTIKGAEESRVQTLLGILRLVFEKLASLLILVVFLATIGQLSQLAARGITLDANIEN